MRESICKVIFNVNLKNKILHIIKKNNLYHQKKYVHPMKNTKQIHYIITYFKKITLKMNKK